MRGRVVLIHARVHRRCSCVRLDVLRRRILLRHGYPLLILWSRKLLRVHRRCSRVRLDVLLGRLRILHLRSVVLLRGRTVSETRLSHDRVYSNQQTGHQEGAAGFLIHCVSPKRALMGVTDVYYSEFRGSVNFLRRYVTYPPELRSGTTSYLCHAAMNFAVAICADENALISFRLEFLPRARKASNRQSEFFLRMVEMMQVKRSGILFVSADRADTALMLNEHLF